jgi:hypothetical protein
MSASGSLASRAVTLQVNPAAPRIVLQPVSGSVLSGRKAQLTVSATGSEPFTYHWQKNNVNLNNGGNVSGVTTATLTLTHVSKPNSGKYRVVISNDAGKATSIAVQLTVK